MVVYVGFTKLSADYGTVQTALGAIMMKIFMLFSYLIDGFAYAGEALTGRFIGEKNNNELRTTVRKIFIASGVIAAISTIILWLWGTDMIGLMTTDGSIRSASTNLIVFLVVMPVISTPDFIWDGIFIGATRGRDLMVAMILSAVSFIAVYLILYKMCGIYALYVAYHAHLVARSVYLTIRYHSPRTSFKASQSD